MPDLLWSALFVLLSIAGGIIVFVVLYVAAQVADDWTGGEKLADAIWYRCYELENMLKRIW